MEVWKDIPFCKDLYQASDQGRIKSKSKCNLIVAVDNGFGYMRVTICHDHKKKTRYVHRLVMEAFHGESKLQVDHLNANKSDNRLINLEYVTSRENQSRRKLNRSLPVGVQEREGKFRSRIRVGDKLINLGTYENPQDARNAYLNKLSSL